MRNPEPRRLKIRIHAPDDSAVHAREALPGCGRLALVILATALLTMVGCSRGGNKVPSPAELASICISSPTGTTTAMTLPGIEIPGHHDASQASIMHAQHRDVEVVALDHWSGPFQYSGEREFGGSILSSLILDAETALQRLFPVLATLGAGEHAALHGTDEGHMLVQAALMSPTQGAEIKHLPVRDLVDQAPSRSVQTARLHVAPRQPAAPGLMAFGICHDGGHGTEFIARRWPGKYATAVPSGATGGHQAQATARLQMNSPAMVSALDRANLAKLVPVLGDGLVDRYLAGAGACTGGLARAPYGIPDTYPSAGPAYELEAINHPSGPNPERQSGYAENRPDTGIKPAPLAGSADGNRLVIARYAEPGQAQYRQYAVAHEPAPASVRAPNRSIMNPVVRRQEARHPAAGTAVFLQITKERGTGGAPHQLSWIAAAMGWPGNGGNVETSFQHLLQVR